MSLQPGEQLGKVKLVRPIGRGGMAEVWEGVDVTLGRAVALKVILEELDDPKLIERFAREARLAARLEHPHILPIYELGEHRGQLYLVMPLVTGGSLRERLRDPMDAATALRWIQEIGSALDEAHREGVVHRDVKPANLLFDRTGRIVLADFGLAKQQVSSHELTTVGTALGTPGYMAPEQLRGEALDGRADQYSLACVAYRLLSGRTPFEGSVFTILTKTLTQAPDPPSRWNRAVTPRQDQAILRALAKEPADRFESCRAFSSALLEGPARAAALPAPRPRVVSERADRIETLATPTFGQAAPATGHPGLFGLVVVALVLGAGALWRWRSLALSPRAGDGVAAVAPPTGAPAATIQETRVVSPPPDRRPLRAKQDLLNLASALALYRTVRNDYPEGEAGSGLLPRSALRGSRSTRDVPDSDPWGSPYIYLTSSGRDHFLVATPGANFKLEVTDANLRTMLDTGCRGKALASHDPAADQIVCDGRLLMSYEPPTPGR